MALKGTGHTALTALNSKLLPWKNAPPGGPFAAGRIHIARSRRRSRLLRAGIHFCARATRSPDEGIKKQSKTPALQPTTSGRDAQGPPPPNDLPHIESRRKPPSRNGRPVTHNVTLRIPADPRPIDRTAEASSESMIWARLLLIPHTYRPHHAIIPDVCRPLVAQT